jgi:NADH pyrophosphatase NudC (nudix superfamily)
LQKTLAQKYYIFLSGGKIEPGESEIECAQREALEESGYKIKIIEKSETKVKHKTTWDNMKYDCMTPFFAAKILENTVKIEINDADYHRGQALINVQEIDKYVKNETEQKTIKDINHNWFPEINKKKMKKIINYSNDLSLVIDKPALDLLKITEDTHLEIEIFAKKNDSHQPRS